MRRYRFTAKRVGQSVVFTLPKQGTFSQDIPRQTITIERAEVLLSPPDDYSIRISRSGVYDLSIFMHLDVNLPGANYYQVIIRRGERRGSQTFWSDVAGSEAVHSGDLHMETTTYLNEGDQLVLIMLRSFGAVRIVYTISGGNFTGRIR